MVNWHTNTIRGIKFTNREFDIISCILDVRGTKKIANILDISPRTAEGHIQNIMMKISCNSKESIIDFVLKDENYPLIKQHYINLLLNNFFNEQLKKLLNSTRKHQLSYSIITNVATDDTAYKEQLTLLRKTLKQLNIQQANSDSQNARKIIVISEKSDLNNNASSQEVFLVFDKIVADKLDDIDYIDFTNKDDFHVSFFKLLSQIFPEIDVSDFSTEFQIFKSNTNKSKEEVARQVSENEDKNKDIVKETVVAEDIAGNDKATQDDDTEIIKKTLWDHVFKFNIYTLITALVIASIVVFTIYKLNYPTQNLISSDFVVPHKTVMLKREKILNIISKKFNNSREDIKVVAIVGIGGSGKTTIARSYARSISSSLIWEINAETKTSLLNSFEQLAYLLVTSDEEREELESILTVTDFTKKETRLINFVTKNIKLHDNWLIVYDNVESFSDIQNYFPSNSKVWGNGRVIITTQNSNIASSSYIKGNNVIMLDELGDDEKFELFTKILYQADRQTLSVAEQEKITNFLQNIPPFPLDVSTAAYYILAEKVSYQEYLNNISKNNDDFLKNQQDILQEVGEYTNTRYNIITLSLAKIIAENPDFKEILLFCSLVDSQNIPKDLLVRFKSKSLVSKFIYILKKYSFVIENSNDTEQPANTAQELTAFSLHRSMQQVSLAYLIKNLELEEFQQLIKKISYELTTYSDKILEQNQDNAVSNIITHLKAFLNHKELLPEMARANVSLVTGRYYLTVSDNEKAKIYLENAAKIYVKYFDVKAIATNTDTFVFLGRVYSNMGKYEQAQILLENNLNALQSYYGNNHRLVAWNAVYLAELYSNIGKYQKAEDLLQNTTKIYTANHGENHTTVAWSLSSLGNLYNSIGNYAAAEHYLQRSLKIYQDNYGENNPKNLWILNDLSNLYINMGNYQKAEEILQQSLAMQKNNGNINNKDKNSDWLLFNLGNLYHEMGQSELAKSHLEKSWQSSKVHYGVNSYNTMKNALYLGKIYSDMGAYIKADELIMPALEFYLKRFGNNHLKYANSLMIVGFHQLKKGELELAEENITKAFNIYENNKHPQIYRCFEYLAEIYQLKALKTNNNKRKKDYQDKSIKYLQLALEQAKQTLPADSRHLQRILQSLLQ